MPSLHEAYVGGLFRNDAGYHFGFRLMNETTWKTHVLRFGDSPVSLVAVPPGHYRVVHWLAWKADHSPSWCKTFRPSRILASTSWWWVGR
jgi:hypothetical protein